MSVSPAHQAVIDSVKHTTGVVKSATKALNEFPARIEAIKDQAVQDGATVEELVALLETEIAEQRAEVDLLAAAVAENP